MELFNNLQKFIISTQNFEQLKALVEPPPQTVVVKRKAEEVEATQPKKRERKEEAKESKEESKKESKEERKSPNEFHIPPDNDTLFWSFYYLSRNEDRDFFERHNIVQEKQLKIHWVEEVRKNKALLKNNYKFASLAHIENQLANETRIDLPTFLSLCALQQIDVCVVRKKTQFPLICSNNGILYILKEVHRNRYGFKLDTMGLQHYKDNYFEIEKIDKPIKSSSGYTLEELQQFCAKLDISIVKDETRKKKTKTELYEAIVQSMPL